MPEQNWQRRWHSLLQEWVLIAANTQNRPMTQGAAKKDISEQPGYEPDYDPDCYLCPNNTRASGDTNPDYEQTFVFENDFPSLAMNAPVPKPSPSPNTQSKKVFESVDHLQGECRVVCFDPNHNIDLADLSLDKIVSVFQALQSQFYKLSQNSLIENILMFENKGKEAGASNPHPHGQIYATPFIPKNIETQLHSFQKYKKETKQCLMCELIKHEKNSKRLLLENDHFIAVVPFFARFAYEVLIIPKRHRTKMSLYSASELTSLADMYQQLMKAYDKLFNMPFANIISWINSPLKAGKVYEEFHCYLSFCPPLRSATQVKYLAGFESAGGNIVNPVQPEVAAQELKNALNADLFYNL
jgi:UDPglucose--hexose-1-phosphate uridylyltransferase